MKRKWSRFSDKTLFRNYINSATVYESDRNIVYESDR